MAEAEPELKLCVSQELSPNLPRGEQAPKLLESLPLPPGA